MGKKSFNKKKNDKDENKKFFESLKKIIKFKKKIINVLDIGCSTGNFLKYCDQHFKWNLHGIEPSYESFKVANKQCGKKLKLKTVI